MVFSRCVRYNQNFDGVKLLLHHIFIGPKIRYRVLMYEYRIASTRPEIIAGALYKCSIISINIEGVRVTRYNYLPQSIIT